jgi:hypothetical protein
MNSKYLFIEYGQRLCCVANRQFGDDLAAWSVYGGRGHSSVTINLLTDLNAASNYAD